MSLDIHTKNIVCVLLFDRWHVVCPGTFYLDAYEFIGDNYHSVFVGGASPLVSSTGFTFDEVVGGKHVKVSGPLTSILAVQETVSNYNEGLT